MSARARARDLLLRPPWPRPILQVLHAYHLSPPGPGIRAEIRHPLSGLVQRGSRLGLRQRDPARPAGLRHARQAGGRRGGARARSSGRRMDVRTTSLDVPPRADGHRPRVPPVNGGEAMDRTRIDLLSALARDASLERSDYLVRAAEQFQRFLEANTSSIKEIGGLTLIDEDPDYLAIAPDLTFRSRSRYLDDATGEWHSETEVVESAAEIVELYSPAELYTAFTEAARTAAGLEVDAGDDDAEGDDDEESDDEAVPAVAGTPGDPYVAAADSWAASQDDGPVTGEQDAARRLYDLALSCLLY